MIKKSKIIERVVEYAKLPYYFREGPRKEKIVKELDALGIEPKMTIDDNVCYRKGEGLPITLISSHYDTCIPDVSQLPAEIIESGGITKIRAYLDNAACVAVNREIIERIEPRGTMWNIFTNEEEDYPGCKSEYGIEKVCDELESMGIKPDLGIALDVTLSENSNQNNADVYIENFSSVGLTKVFEAFISKNKFNPFVKIRNKKSKDEATPLGERYPAFALCPGIEGEMHGISVVNADSLELSTQFLERLLKSPDFIRKASDEDRKFKLRSY
jgi:putative aminopeptidase FrvX